MLAQVLKKSLSLVEPTVRTDAGFEYEEGEGLDEDEVAVNKAKLPLPLNQQAGHCHPFNEPNEDCSACTACTLAAWGTLLLQAINYGVQPRGRAMTLPAC